MRYNRDAYLHEKFLIIRLGARLDTRGRNGMMLHEIKKAVRAALKKNDVAGIVAIAREDRRTLNVLIGSSYDKESVESWRAVKAIGAAVKAIVDTEYDFVRETIRRLLWSIREESGCIGWSAPEMLGEIVSADPKRFADITPIIASFHEEENFRAGVLYALARVAEVAPEQIQPQRDLVIASLSDRDPLVQTYALMVIKNACIKGAEPRVQQMVPSTTEVKVFRDGGFVVTSIGAIAADV